MKHFFIALFFFASYSIFSQTMPDSVIALINNNPVYASEFIKIKNKIVAIKSRLCFIVSSF